MRRAHTVEEVRTAERELMARLPAGALMQRAAAGLAHAVVDLLGAAYGRRVLLLVGSGDNGGDALYAGARVARRGAQVEAWLLSDRAHEGGMAALRVAGGRLVRASVRPGAPSPARAAGFDVVVDGVVGIGGHGGLRKDAAAALALVRGIPVVAVDVPSGVDVDTGEVAAGAAHVEAAVTVTFGTHKVAHLVDPAAAVCGTVHLVDIGLGDDLRDSRPAVEALQEDDVAALLPRPERDAQKYTRGVVGIRCGSAQYPGAGLLSVAGAATGLAGMVRYVGDREVGDRVRQAHPEVVGDGRVQAWVVGSGGGEQAGESLRDALADGVPTVIDADALAHLAEATDARQLPAHCVLTPHAGELARLLGTEREQVEAAPLAHARRATERFGCVVLLKGRRTLVAAPGGRVRANPTGTAWLATAGAGDVLGGLVGALLAAGLEAYDAASVGAWLHGAAATLASAGGPLVAGDVAAHLAEVVRRLPSRD